jgi:hypothetical protein
MPRAARPCSPRSPWRPWRNRSQRGGGAEPARRCLGHRGPRHLSRDPAPVAAAGSDLGRQRRGAAGARRIAAARRGVAGDRLRRRCVPVPDRHPGLSGRHPRHGVPVQRCHGGSAHARGGGSRAHRKSREPAAVSPGLCVHRKRRFVRAPDQQSGQSRHLWQSHAATAALAAALCAALDTVDRSHLSRAAAVAARGPAPDNRR